MAFALISKLLQQDLNNARQLLALLQEERAELEKRNVKALDDILARKATLLADMENNDQARRKHLDEAGYPVTRDGLLDYCEQLDQQQGELGRDADSALLTQCQRLFEELKACRELTEINGTIVSRSRHNNSRLLDILRGKTMQSDTYSPDGDTGKQQHSRPLGSV